MVPPLLLTGLLSLSMFLPRLLFLCGFVLLPTFSYAGSFRKCVSADGRVTYTDLLCPAEAQRRDVPIVDNVVEGERPTRASRAMRVPAAPAAIMPTGAASLTGPTLACERLQREYEMAAGSIKPEPKEVNRRRVAARQACGPEFELAFGKHDGAKPAHRAKRHAVREASDRPVP